MSKALLICCAAASLLAAAACSVKPPVEKTSSSASSSPEQCASLADISGEVAGETYRISEAVWRQDGYMVDPGRGQPPVPARAHCEITGRIQERVTAAGESYAIGFHLRLPAEWNDRFLFQGGGGSNGVIGTAIGPTGAGNASALTKGFAVVSQDSGHENQSNYDPARGGELVFGLDPLARRNYGHASLPLTYGVAQQLIGKFYGKSPRYNYFYGCSKGGQEGMMFAQRYPDAFDGIVANAPGMSLPRAAVEEIWDTQAFAQVAKKGDLAELNVKTLAATFSDAQFRAVANAALSACDGADGLDDGIIADFEACKTALVEPALKRNLCDAGANDECLSPDQVAAVIKVFNGAERSDGEQIYASFPWDAGVASPGWRVWKIGSADGAVPPLNVLLGGGSLAAVFMTPPEGLPGDPNIRLKWIMSFNFDSDVPKIYATNADFTSSAWQDVGARSPNLDAFRKDGGKMIVAHGVSDPVFSVNDTISWWKEVDARYSGEAAMFARVFPVPGMNHCGGGPATSRFDAFDSLVSWVEDGTPPDTIVATADEESPWPGRSRPLCPYPLISRYKGAGSIEEAENFECAPPK